MSAHVNELENFINEQAPDVVCLQETFLKPHMEFNLPGYEIIRKDRLYNQKGGLAILIRENIGYSEIETKSMQIEYMKMKIKTSNGYINLSNCYIVPESKIQNRELEIIFGDQVTELIVGDFNAKNPIWGGNEWNSLGRQIESVISETNKIILNTGLPTRQNYNGSMSSIDLTFSSNNLAIKSQWEVTDNCLGSDHLPIIVKINENLYEEDDAEIKFKINTANWGRFKQECKNQFQEGIVDGNIDKFYENIKNAIIAAANASMDQSRSNKRRQRGKKNLPYWNTNLKIIIKERNRARNIMNRSKTKENCDVYRRQKGIAQRAIKLAARDHWRKYCEGLTHTSRLSSIWEATKRMNGAAKKQNIATIIQNNRRFETNLGKANVLAKTFENVSSDENNTEEFRKNKKEMEEKYNHILNPKNAPSVPNIDNEYMNRDFSFFELKQVLKKTKNGSSPGEDKISYSMLKQIPNSCLRIICLFFNQSWSSGNIPASFKHAIVLPILKFGKNKSDSNSYRPISLTNSLAKIMERLVTERLTYKLETCNLLTINQTGFRKNRSTIDQIVRLQDHISRHLHNKMHTLALFIDFKAAFDMLWKNGVLIKLHDMKIDGRIFEWIKTFLSNRSFQTRVGNILSEIKYMENGTPQGSPLSPILFLVAINDLPSILNKETNCSLFADDCAIYCSNFNYKLQRSKSQLQSDLIKIQSWCETWGFKISIDKTTSVLFTGNPKLKRDMSLQLNGNEINIAGSAKFLGVIFDERLNFKEHIDAIYIKCQRRLNLMKSLSGADWGSSRRSQMMIYRQLIRPILDYGCIGYDVMSDSQKQRLDSIQYQALKIASGAMITTSLNALQVISGEPPLKLRRLELQCKYLLKTKVLPLHPAESINKIDWKVRFRKFPPNQEPLVLKTKTFFENQEIVTKCNIIKNQFSYGYTNLKLELKELNKRVEIYTDGLWQVDWTTSEKGRHFHLINPIVERNIKFPLYNRKKDVLISRLKLGKCGSNLCLHNINRHENGLCSFCNVEETINHILLECDSNSIKNKLKQFCILNKINFDLKTILNSNKCHDIINLNLNRKL